MAFPPYLMSVSDDRFKIGPFEIDIKYGRVPFLHKCQIPLVLVMLDWFNTALSWNKQRRVSEVDPTMVASDGFMYNLVSVLNIFAVPLLSPETHIKVSQMGTLRAGVPCERS